MSAPLPRPLSGAAGLTGGSKLLFLTFLRTWACTGRPGLRLSQSGRWPVPARRVGPSCGGDVTARDVTSPTGVPPGLPGPGATLLRTRCVSSSRFWFVPPDPSPVLICDCYVPLAALRVAGSAQVVQLRSTDFRDSAFNMSYFCELAPRSTAGEERPTRTGRQGPTSRSKTQVSLAGAAAALRGWVLLLHRRVALASHLARASLSESGCLTPTRRSTLARWRRLARFLELSTSVWPRSSALGAAAARRGFVWTSPLPLAPEPHELLLLMETVVLCVSH